MAAEPTPTDAELERLPSSFRGTVMIYNMNAGGVLWKQFYS